MIGQHVGLLKLWVDMPKPGDLYCPVGNFQVHSPLPQKKWKKKFRSKLQRRQKVNHEVNQSHQSRKSHFSRKQRDFLKWKIRPLRSREGKRGEGGTMVEHEWNQSGTGLMIFKQKVGFTNTFSDQLSTTPCERKEASILFTPTFATHLQSKGSHISTPLFPATPSCSFSRG